MKYRVRFEIDEEVEADSRHSAVDEVDDELNG